MEPLAEILDRLKELDGAEREAGLVILSAFAASSALRGSRRRGRLARVEVNLHGFDKLGCRLGAACRAGNAECA